ncbi:MAG: hypothetical protein ACRCVP_09770 [Shewanella xiamenensis]
MTTATEFKTSSKNSTFNRERIAKALNSSFTTASKKLSKDEIKSLILSRA